MSGQEKDKRGMRQELEEHLADCDSVLAIAVSNGVDYLDVALGAPEVYRNFMMEQKVWASKAPNPYDEPLPKLDPILNGVPYDVDTCLKHLHEDPFYTGLVRFYTPGSCLDHAANCLYAANIDLLRLYKAYVVSMCLMQRPLGTDPLGQNMAVRHEMEKDANRAYQKAQESKGTQRYNAVRRWICSLLASRIGLPVQYKSADVTFFPAGGSIGEWMHLPPVMTHLPRLTRNKMLRTLYWVSQSILRAEVGSVSVPMHGVELATKDIVFDIQAGHQPFDSRPHFAGLIELYRSLLNVWKLKDDERLSHLLNSKFATYYWNEGFPEREGRISWCIGQWAADCFEISTPPVDLHRLVVSELAGFCSSNEQAIRMARYGRAICKLVTGDTPPLPKWVDDLDKEIRSRLEDALEGDLGEQGEIDRVAAQLSADDPGLVRSLEASGHKALTKLSSPTWHGVLGEVGERHLLAGEYDFVSYINGPVECTRLSGVDRPVDCRTAYMHYCRAIEAVAWDLVFCPAIKQAAATIDSNVIESWQKDLCNDSTAVKSDIGEAESTLRTLMVNSVTERLDRKDLTLGSMGFLVRRILTQAEMESQNLTDASSGDLLNATPAIRAFFKSDAGYNFFFSMETGTRGAIENFASKYRNLEAHPNEVVTWSEALNGRRFACSLLEWFACSCPSDTSKAGYWEALCRIKENTPIPWLMVKNDPFDLLVNCGLFDSIGSR